jgi:hypothetical protein
MGHLNNPSLIFKRFQILACLYRTEDASQQGTLESTTSQADTEVASPS